MRIVIAGGGPAAMESAAAARKFAPDAEIDIYSEENLLPYRRPALSGLLAAGKSIDEKSFFIRKETFFAENDIAFHVGKKAVSISEKSLIFSDGTSTGFDRLILAYGSRAVKLPIPGSDLPGVYTLRSAADMQNIVKKLDSGVKNAVIIGGGVLGLEIADSFISRKINTVVTEAADHLFKGRLSEDESAALLARLNDLEYLHVVCGKCAVSINETSVLLADGEIFKADIVLIAAGCRPDLEVAKSANLQCGRGVIVNKYMQSSREDIFAAGDVAEFEGKCFNLYMDAMASGKTAGANAAGEKMEFIPQNTPLRFFALNEKLIMK